MNTNKRSRFFQIAALAVLVLQGAFAICAPSANAQSIRHKVTLVFDFEGVLAQPISSDRVSSFAPTELFSATVSGKAQSYVLYPHVRDLFTWLYRRYDIEFVLVYTPEKLAAVQALVNTVQLTDSSGLKLSSLVSLVSEEDLLKRSPFLAASRVIPVGMGEAVVNTLYFRASKTAPIHLNTIRLKPATIPDSAFPISDPDLAASADAPRTRLDWFWERNKLAQVYFWVDRALQSSRGPLLQSIAPFLKKSPELAIRIGEGLLEYPTADRVTKWEYAFETGTISGCAEYDTATLLRVNTLSNAECARTHVTMTRWKASSSAVSGCIEVDRDLGMTLRTLDYSVCEKSSDVFAFWKDAKRSQCSLFTGDLKEIRAIRLGECRLAEQFVVFDPKTKRYFEYGEFEGMETATPEKLLEVAHQSTKQSIIANAAVRMIRTDLRLYTRTLDREVSTYNWRSVKDFNSTEKNRLSMSPQLELADSSILDYARHWRDAYKTHGVADGGMVGFGLYAANTPRQSQSYGTNDGGIPGALLTEIRFPKAANYLDLTPGSSFRLKPATVSYLNSKLGCGISGSDIGFKTAVNDTVQVTVAAKQTLTRSEACRAVLTRAIQDLKLEFLVYDWNGGHEGCNGAGSGVAFVVLEGKLDPSTVRAYSNTLESGASSQKREAYTEIAALLRSFGASAFSWASQVTSSSVSAEARSRIYRCYSETPQDKAPWR